MKYMIHSCNKRLWYVEQFLIPEMKSQGIADEQIILWNDYKGAGNLASWLCSAKAVSELMSQRDCTWHLQDDIMLASDFKSISEGCPHDKVVNGVCLWDKHVNCVGWQPVKKHWWSFQCCQIPNKYLREFLAFYNDEIIGKGRELERRQKNNNDDWFFWQYMKERRKTEECLNLIPNIVQHIDYALGGTTLGFAYRPHSRAHYWREEEREEQLAKQIKQFLMEESIADGKTKNRNR